MKLYLDDIREAPKGWKLTTTATETINYLISNQITELSLDHDLGIDETGYDVLLWIEEEVILNNFLPPKIHIHTSNSSARIKMLQAVQQIKKISKENN
jgi:hypothetical protein